MSEITTILTLMLLSSSLAASYKRLRYLTLGTLTPIKVGAPLSENVRPSRVPRFDSVDGRRLNAS